MNITISIPCLNRGGTEMQTINLVKVLINEGYIVNTLCYFEFDPEVVTEYQQAGSKVELMKLQRSIRPWTLIHLLRKQFIAHQPDAIHVQYMAPGALPIIAARLAGIKKIIATVHQPCTPSHGRLARLLLRFSANLCTRFIAVSVNAEISWFKNGQLFDSNKTLKNQPQHFTIYNAVNLAAIQKIKQQSDFQKKKNRLSIPSGQLIIGAVSRLRYEKGIDLLIESFAQVIKQHHHIHLLIVGTGPDESQLKEKIRNLKLELNTTFFGEASWETAMQQMALMDVVVVPSRFEGFGLTAAEAMAMGKPVIASNVFGLCEVVNDGETGILFPVGDTKVLANSLLRLCNEPDLRSTMGANGKIKTQKLFDISVYNQKTTHLYTEIFK